MQINNEPVAVVDHRQQNGVTWLKIKKGKSVMPDHNTLLYTHPANEAICLSKAEIESGLSRVKWAELLIKQLPEEHEGRNSWLLNYGEKK